MCGPQQDVARERALRSGEADRLDGTDLVHVGDHVAEKSREVLRRVQSVSHAPEATEGHVRRNRLNPQARHHRLPVLTRCPGACQKLGNSHSMERGVTPVGRGPAEDLRLDLGGTAETLTILTPASPPRSGLYCRWRGSRARQQPGVRRACVRRDATEADVTSITMQFLC